MSPHIPVLRERVAELLAAAPPGTVVDCTVGAGGHAGAVQRARRQVHADARLLGVDRDPEALAAAREGLAGVPDVELLHGGFEELDRLLDQAGVDLAAGFVFDLGLSSLQVDRGERGFSYRRDGPLDMRMDPGQDLTAATVVNRYPEVELARVLSRYGEERFARRIAAAIVRARPLERTTELAGVVREAIPAAARRTGPHPATRTFQALRIEVNGELRALETALPLALDRLMPGGVCAVISYHSLEDRIVKRAFAAASRGCTCPPDLPVCACGRSPAVEHVVRRPERPGPDEIERNPRARSARLRCVRRLDGREPATEEVLR